MAEWILSGGIPGPALLPKEVALQNVVTHDLWEAELLEDPALAERWVVALPPDLAAKFRATLDEFRRPHPLQVTTPEEWWACLSCGASFDEGEAEAVVVGDREGHSDLDYPLTFCADCIVLVADIMRGETWTI